MADQADVARALEDVADAVRVAQGATWTVYRGYPEAAALDAEIKAGDVHVTVNPRPGGFTRNTTRYLQQDAVTVRPVPSLTVAVDGDTATFGGTADPGQAAGVQVGHAAWVTRTQAGDTPPAVASGLAALVPGASAAGRHAHRAWPHPGPHRRRRHRVHDPSQHRAAVHPDRLVRRPRHSGRRGRQPGCGAVRAHLPAAAGQRGRAHPLRGATSPATRPRAPRSTRGCCTTA